MTTVFSKRGGSGGRSNNRTKPKPSTEKKKKTLEDYILQV